MRLNIPRVLLVAALGVVAGRPPGIPADLHAQTQGGAQTNAKRPAWELRRDRFAELIGLSPEDYRKLGVANMHHHIEVGLIARKSADVDARKRALIALLDAENKTVAGEKVLSEEYVNYYGDVVAAVATLNDPRSLSALLGAITTGNMVWSTLIGFGPSAVAPVTGLLVSPEDRVRSTATLTLSEMLVRSREIATDAHSRQTIKAALADASMDRSYLVRMRAVVGLARLGDVDALAMVKELAANDPFRDEMREGRYIVREAAAEALQTQVPRRQTH